MSSPFATYPAPERSFIPSNYTSRPSLPAAAKTTGGKRVRKPKASSPSGSRGSPAASNQPSPIQWAATQSNVSPTVPSPTIPASISSELQSQLSSETGAVINLSGAGDPSSSTPARESSQAPRTSVPAAGPPGAGGEEEGEGEDEMLPAMADDDYSAQLSWQSQSKDNLKVLMDNFSAAQYDRFEAYRRHALPKQAVRKVIQQTLGQQVSQPVAQIVAGFAKVFVGEMMEKAREVQKRRGDTGPLSPDHLREAYRMYQEETGRVGAARPVRSKRLFVR